MQFENKTYHFKDSLEQFTSGLVVVPFLAFMEAVAIGKGMLDT